MTPVTGVRDIRRTAVLLLLLGCFAPVEAKPQAPDEPELIRSAFMLGFSYGNGHNLYSQNPTLPGEVRGAYDAWMADAAGYGERLGVTVDISPPPVDPSSSTAQADAIRAGTRLRDVLGIRIMGQHGEAPVVALELGYRAALAIEILPHLPPEMQREERQELARLAAAMGLPQPLLDRYVDVLVTTVDRERTVLALFAFKDDVAGHYEGLRVATSESGARDHLFIWRMGWTLGLATLGKTRGAEDDAVDGLFEESRAFGAAVGVRVPSLPEAADDSPRQTASAIHYLLEGAGEFVHPQLESRYGPRATALFELALKSVLAMLLYGPEDDMGTTMRDVIARAGGQSGLPESVYQPVVRLMSAGAPAEEVKQELIAMNERVVTHYSSAGAAPRRLERAARPAPEAIGTLTAYEDPAGLFRVSVPGSWRSERDEGWATGLANTYTRTTMFAPADAQLAAVDGYLSEGVRITFHLPPEGEEWTMAAVDEWAPTFADRLLEFNPGFALTSTSSLTVGGHPAIEYQMVGQSPQIPEPEKAFFVIVANERYRMVMEIVSPTSRLPYFNGLRTSLLESFRLLQ